MLNWIFSVSKQSEYLYNQKKFLIKKTWITQYLSLKKKDKLIDKKIQLRCNVETKCIKTFFSNKKTPIINKNKN